MFKSIPDGNKKYKKYTYIAHTSEFSGAVLLGYSIILSDQVSYNGPATMV